MPAVLPRQPSPKPACFPVPRLPSTAPVNGIKRKTFVYITESQYFGLGTSFVTNSLGSATSRPTEPPRMETVNCPFHRRGRGGTSVGHSCCEAPSWTSPQGQGALSRVLVQSLLPACPATAWRTQCPGTHTRGN